ncbi:unnamed protein product [Medioppia subpectinata]|uniref:Uncharacterized protein n=1 Tax=Medioppia subpectinata TaxID=1979941 RepID=A0A7R9PW78_9ACAR|nr:unnamed protein product [Medioppia subpectinata]CAG2102604.1 unnamed protein product [Medioppia subpectinata]
MSYLLRSTKRSICLSSLVRRTNGQLICSQSLRWSYCPQCLHNSNIRCYASQSPQQKGFIGKLIDNIKQEMSKNKEMKESLKKFREEAQKLEDSEALQKARHKYQSIESETAKSGQQFKEHLESIKDKISKGIEDAQKTEIGKKGIEMTDELQKQAKSAAEAFTKQTEQLSQSDAFKTVSQTVKAVGEEIGETGRVYKRPEKLRKRKEESEDMFAHQKPIEPNELVFKCIYIS